MATISKAKKTEEVKTEAVSGFEYQAIEPFLCEFKASNQTHQGEARESNGKMYSVVYSVDGEQLEARLPIAKVKPIETAVSENLVDVGVREASPLEKASPLENPALAETLAAQESEPHPTEFTDCEPIAAVYRKGKIEHQVTIVAQRNDGKLYRIHGDAIGTLALPIEKVMIIAPEPAEQQQEPAAPPAVPEGWAMVEGMDWERKPVPIAEIKGSDVSPAQISNRYSNQHEREIRDKMLLGVWDYERPGSEPRLFWDGTEHHTGDGHHTAQGLQAAIAWLDDAVATGKPNSPDEQLVERFNAGLIELPMEIPCYVKPGTAHDASAYSLREANRFHGMKLTPEQKRGAAWDTITDRDMLREVVQWICEKTGKDYAKFADSIPADRAIAAWLDNISAPTVAEVWAEAIAADEKVDDMRWPWLLADKRMGMDGKVQKVKAKPEPKAEPPAPPPQVKKLTPGENTEQIDDTDAVDRWSPTDRRSSGNSVGGGSGGSGGGGSAESTAAPTDSNPVTPGQTYTGKARFKRIQDLAEAAAEKLIATIAAEMKTKIPATESYEALTVAIRQELEYHVTGVEF